jgi:hypothetical protein
MPLSTLLPEAHRVFFMLRTSDTWKVLLAGICSLILTVGLARFAYTPLLPVMRAETWLTEVAGGWLATFNYC